MIDYYKEFQIKAFVLYTFNLLVDCLQITIML
jgi:hypothetical protein